MEPRFTGFKWIRLVLYLLLSIGVGGILALVVTQNRVGDERSSNTTLTLTSAPDFSVPLYTGGTGEFTLSDHRGHPVVVNFWSSWCSPCRAEFPGLQAIANKYKADGVVVIGVNVQDTEEDARAFLDEQGTTFKAGPDNTGMVAHDYKLMGLPSTFFISRDGILSKDWVGEIDEEKLSEFVEELIAL